MVLVKNKLHVLDVCLVIFEVDLITHSFTHLFVQLFSHVFVCVYCVKHGNKNHREADKTVPDARVIRPLLIHA